MAYKDSDYTIVIALVYLLTRFLMPKLTLVVEL